MPVVDSQPSLQFDHPDYIAVERGLTEIRGGRPVLMTDGGTGTLVLPVDGVDEWRLSRFLALARPPQIRLTITGRRARTLGLETADPVSLTLESCDAAEIVSLVLAVRPKGMFKSAPATSALRAALDLAKLAQRLPAVVSLDGKVADMVPVEPPIVSVASGAVAQFRTQAIRSLKIAGEANVPLENGIRSRFVIFRSAFGGDCAAVIVGTPNFNEAVPLRLHSACLTGDVFGSRRCDCGDQLGMALGELAAIGGGIILYLDQEGRGLGLANKMRAYGLQDGGLDTVDANMSLGFDDDERDYGVAGQMLKMLGCTTVELFTNNPSKVSGLMQAGIEISARKPLLAPVNTDNLRYLTTKAMRAGHSLDYLLETVAEDVREKTPLP